MQLSNYPARSTKGRRFSGLGLEAADQLPGRVDLAGVLLPFVLLGVRRVVRGGCRMGVLPAVTPFRDVHSGTLLRPSPKERGRVAPYPDHSDGLETVWMGGLRCRAIDANVQ